MMKLLYYNMLNFQHTNLEILQNNFEVIKLENPLYDTDEILAQIDVAFAPLGFKFDEDKISRMENGEGIKRWRGL